MLSVKNFEEYAMNNLNKKVKDYYNSGSNEEETLRDNLIGYKKLRIVPKFLHNDVSKIDTKTSLLGFDVDFPLGVSPTAMQKMAHPDGEIATARACQSNNIIMILSTISTTSLEEINEKTDKNFVKWFQLYIYKNRKITENLIKRAEKSGFKAIVLTVDTPFFARRYADIRNKFHLPPNLRMANFDSTDNQNESNLIQIKPENNSGLAEYSNKLFDPSLTWKDVDWLVNFTKLPVIIKGILSQEDALMSIKHGAKAIIVSNHGGRQLDTVPSTIDVLPEIVKAVDGKIEVFIDGGIRKGTDIFKAISLGAKACFVGRPILWGLSYNGQEGASQVIDILKTEFKETMGLAGCSKIAHLKPDLIRKIESKL